MAKDDTTTAVAVVDAVQAQLAQLGDFAGIIQENLAGEDITTRNLARVTIPSGGGMAWAYPGADGTEARTAFEGVILHRQKARAYWSAGLEAGGGSTPPDCRSDDSFIGIGDPGGDCKICPYAAFGSKVGPGGQQGRGQACKLMSLLYVMVPGELFPLVVVAPPTSVKVVTDYLFRLTSRRQPYYSVVTRFALEQQKSGGGITYSRLAMTTVAELDEPTAAMVRSVQEQMAPLFGAVVEVQAAEVGA